MFYNGFTLLMQLLAGYVAYHVGYKYGHKRGEQDARKQLIAAERTKKELFSSISKKAHWNSNSW